MKVDVDSREGFSPEELAAWAATQGDVELHGTTLVRRVGRGFTSATNHCDQCGGEFPAEQVRKVRQGRGEDDILCLCRKCRS